MRKYVLWLVWILAVIDTFSDAQDNGDDTGAGATVLVISTNEMTHGLHTLATNDLADWFSVDLVAGKYYRFESTGSGDVDAVLYSDTNGIVQVANDQAHGALENFQILYEPAITQTYYLKVYEPGGSDAEYMLAYQEESIYDDWDPVDDIYSNAPTLMMTVAEQLHGLHNLSAVDTEDWFHFFLIEGIEYTFRAVNGGWDTVGELYYNGNTNPDLVTSGDDDYDPSDIDNEFNFIITYTPPVSGNYYLRVIGYEVGDLNYSLIYSHAAILDSDGDGMSDPDEYIAGTDPTNSASYFAVTNWSAGSFILEWPSIAGREYQVFWTDNLTNAFQPLPPVIDYPQNSYTDTTHSAEDAGFYKVEVQLK
jgi:hypothetical protein